METVVIHHVVVVSVVHDMDSMYLNVLFFGCAFILQLWSISSCGAVGAYCVKRKSLEEEPQPASIEGVFKGQATYYNETRVGSDFSTCGTERARSLDEEDQKIYTAALNQVQFDPYTVDGIPSKNPICEKKALVKGPQGEIVVRFVDRCAECKEGKTKNNFIISYILSLLYIRIFRWYWIDRTSIHCCQWWTWYWWNQCWMAIYLNVINKCQ